MAHQWDLWDLGDLCKNQFAVLSRLEDSPRLVHPAYSHLAVIDLSSKARLLYHLDSESLPEGMEFSPDSGQFGFLVSLENSSCDKSCSSSRF